jgi:hypothetical protein
MECPLMGGVAAWPAMSGDGGWRSAPTLSAATRNIIEYLRMSDSFFR